LATSGGNVGIGTTAPGAKLTVAGRISTLHDNYFEALGSVYGGFDEYGETPLFYGAYNRMAFLTKEGGTVDFNPPPTSGTADALFDGTENWVYWQNPSGDISVTINLPTTWNYMRDLIIQFVSSYYPTAFTIEMFQTTDNAWHVFDDVTGWNKNYYAKKTGSFGYNVTKLRITMHAYNSSNYVHIAEIMWTLYNVPSMNYFLYRGGGQNVYGGVNLATVSGNVGIGTTAPDYKLRVEGTVAAYGYVTLSDISLKKDIQPLNYGILDKVLALNPVSFYWKDENIDQEKHFGFISQEVEEVLPELIRQDSQGKKLLNYNEFIPFLVQALKEQQKEIEELKLALNEYGILGTSSEATSSEQSILDRFTLAIKKSLEKLGLFIENGIAKVKEIVTEKLTAEVVVTKEIKTERITTNEIQIVDKATGEIYCTWIENGEWKKVKGECETASNQTANSEQLNSEQSSSEQSSTTESSTNSSSTSTATSTVETNQEISTSTNEQLNTEQSTITSSSTVTTTASSTE
jgi:hypothetical protein